jgi:hypothetical protein
MATVTPDQVTIYVTIGYIVILAIIIYFTRATRCRIAGALIGGLGTAFTLGILIDTIGVSLGLWYYPGFTGRGPLGYNLAFGVLYGAGIALIGWRINRHLGIKGLATFIVLFSLFGVARDYFAVFITESSIIGFGPGIVPVIADALAWIALLTVTQIVMWLIAGPAKADKLART